MRRTRMGRWVAVFGIAVALSTAGSDHPIAAQMPRAADQSSAGQPPAPSSSAEAAGAPAGIEAYRADAERLITAATADRFAWNRLAELTDTYGPRLSGSKNLQLAIEWALAEMRKDGFDNVRAEPVTVPVWVRGHESLDVLEPAPRPLPILGLGDSIGTPPEGVEGETLVVDSFDALDREAARARGRIVVFNVPFTTYGETVRYRTQGPGRAAQHGAVAMLLRAVGPVGLRTPHTGSMAGGGNESRRKIPAAAISAEDAAMLQRLQDRHVRVRLRLKMDAHTLADAESANVVGEIRGRERPEEVVVVGGHLDSWDVGTGASDDGAGCIATWEALRLMKALNLRPRRTVRLVLWTNEENGLRGGLGYLIRHRGELAQHVLMLESDMGVFAPITFGFTGSEHARAKVQAIAAMLTKIGADRVGPSGGGADIGPSVQAANIASMALSGDATRYFQIHHTAADTVDRIDPMDLSRASAAIAVMTYIVADLPERLDAPVQETR
jgi:carboxypeptidase Q